MSSALAGTRRPSNLVTIGIGTVLVVCGLVATAVATASPASAATFSNSASNIVATSMASPCGAPLTAQNYPSEINVTGLTGTVADVDLTLSDIGVEQIGDLDLLLVGPDGTNSVIFSDTGQMQYLDNLTITLDDQAAAQAPFDSGFGPGTYRPGDYTGLNEPSVDEWPAPAPAPSANTTLATFNGTNPNGTWQLYAADDNCANFSAINGGWSLDVRTGPAVATTTTVTSNLNPAQYGQSVTITATVAAAAGPVTAGTVTFREGATILGNAAVNGAGKASMTRTNLALGQHDITATYNGTSAFLSGSGSLRERINDPAAQTYTNTTLNSVAGTSSPCGAPLTLQHYPSEISVAGFTGSVADVNVTLGDIQNQQIGDLDLLLVAPDGTNSVIFSDTGAMQALNTPLHLILDDQAAAQAPFDSGYSSGAYKPSDYAGFNEPAVDEWPVPAPAPSANTTLAAFNGIDPNGTWQLFAVDDNCENFSVIKRWSLEITPPVPPVPVAKQVLISQFRPSGPGGASDDFVELYNNTDRAVPLTGWTLDTSAPGSFALPAATIPARGHYLVAGSAYSLGGYSAADTSPAGFDVDPTGGMRLIGSNAVVIDRVGAGVAGFFEGTALPSIGAANAEVAWVRKAANGVSVDTDNNTADFVLVALDAGVYGGVQSAKGSPAPRATGSPIARNDLVQASLIDPNVAASAAPNRIFASDIQQLTVRRRLTNTSTTKTITSLRLLMTSITVRGGPPAATHAWLRWASSRARTVVTSNGNVSTRALTLSTPPTQTGGGGWNSSAQVSLPTGGLPPGASVSVSLVFNVDQGGTFSFAFDAEPLSTG